MVVNDKIDFLTMLVETDRMPDAKSCWNAKVEEHISLRNVDRLSIQLENGDIVHRHWTEIVFCLTDNHLYTECL
jgi:hypothetical protein